MIYSYRKRSQNTPLSGRRVSTQFLFCLITLRVDTSGIENIFRVSVVMETWAEFWEMSELKWEYDQITIYDPAFLGKLNNFRMLVTPRTLSVLIMRLIWKNALKFHVFSVFLQWFCIEELIDKSKYILIFAPDKRLSNTRICIISSIVSYISGNVYSVTGWSCKSP